MGQIAKRISASAAAPRCFAVSETADGQWLARERHGAVARVFPTQKAAIHFALFEIGNRPASALLTPCDATPGSRHGH
ncbi:MAG: hypothetical protein ACLQJR_32435 [Stellaceae bacterium]